MGWDGDRYAVLEANGDYCVVWWSVWDTERAAERFVGILRSKWPERVISGWRFAIERADVGEQPGVLFMYGPSEWELWDVPPKVTAR